MNYDLLFKLVNLAVLPAWGLLVFAPRWSWTRKLVHTALWPILLGGIYVAGVLTSLVFGIGNQDSGFSTIAQVRAIFASDLGVLVGWCHYLAFDLFVGAWISRDAIDRQIRHLAVVPCLIACLIFGPVGLLLYLAIRKTTGKGGWSLTS